MKKTIYIFLALLCSITIIIFSCKKKALPNAGHGGGGTATLVVLPQHHNISKNIDTCKVYIKYNAQNTPANGQYDDSTNCTCANGVVTCTFDSLRNGDYYLFGLGYDTSVYKHIDGGLYCPINAQHATTTVDLAITEF